MQMVMKTDNAIMKVE